MSQGNAVSWVMHRSGNSHYQKFYRREMYLEELATRSGDPDEFIIEGYEGRWYSEHSEYSQRVDLRIDIEKAMEYMAAKYEHSRPHLAALYYITTSISVEDAAALADRPGAKRAWWLTSIVKPMREELTQLLDLFSPRRATWQEKVRVGQKAPLLELIGQYEQSGDKRMAATLLGLAENTSTKDLMEKLSLPKTHVHYLRRIAHKELNQAYGCSA
jgi:hypothetical protein